MRTCLLGGENLFLENDDVDNFNNDKKRREGLVFSIGVQRFNFTSVPLL